VAAVLRQSNNKPAQLVRLGKLVKKNLREVLAFFTNITLHITIVKNNPSKLDCQE
jgi:hypothetical protein